MLIHEPETELFDGELRVTARIELGRALEGVPEDLWFVVPATQQRLVNDRSDPFLVAMLPIALALGEDSEVRGRVSPRLVYGAMQYQDAQRAFWPRHAGRPIAISANKPEPTSLRGQAVACMPTASPAMMFVAWPVSLALAMSFTGAKLFEV